MQGEAGRSGERGREGSREGGSVCVCVCYPPAPPAFLGARGFAPAVCGGFVQRFRLSGFRVVPVVLLPEGFRLFSPSFERNSDLSTQTMNPYS